MKGFHVAFAGGAVFVVVALGLFLAMLRRKDVEAIEAAAAATAPAADQPERRYGRAGTPCRSTARS